MDQHTAMNDAGNFLIETCDETVSLDLKQQLLLLNGRWRDLFLKVKQVLNKKKTVHPKKSCMSVMYLFIDLLYGVFLLSLLQYAHSDELDKWRKDHLKAVWALKELLDTAETKLNAPIQVSFLSVRAFLQDVEVRKTNCQSQCEEQRSAAFWMCNQHLGSEKV